jgi:hypothetical protein
VISFERRRQQRWTLLNVGWDPEQPPGGVTRKLLFFSQKENYHEETTPTYLLEQY